ncbi:hypothetical protein G9C98_007058 [Cotesia typhae]|uniref:Vesicular glutamate transporter n=1 Tax=Cotesia typhae TaxID=2053667 RepID=A0A8J5RKK2_9HYME|nr:hypothetical protein G9C98_007058 [Cotesia typhae]
MRWRRREALRGSYELAEDDDDVHRRDPALSNPLRTYAHLDLIIGNPNNLKMSGFAAAGLGALATIKSRVDGKLAELRIERRNQRGYEEFAMPNNESAKDNMGYEQDRDLQPRGSLDSLPEPERPPLRHIDTYCMPECPCLSKRYTIATLACLGFVISFGMRCNMSMAKLIMKNDTNSDGQPKFNWTVGTEGLLDSSFFWGYLVTQVPGGFLASLYPANRIFGMAIAASSFLNLLVPGALSVHAAVDMCVQVLKGLVEGVTYPACHGIWKYWAPPLERSRLATLAFCGSYAAVVIGMPLSALLSNSFEDSLGKGLNTQPIPTFSSTPWKKFFTSMPVYAIIVANFCRSWNFYLLVLFQARFMHESFDMPLVETGVVGSLPHLLMTIIVPCGGLLADHLRKTGRMTTTNVRKLFNCGGFGMEALFFLVVANATTNNNGAGATIALAIGVACSGFAISGFNVNHLDIAPRYASILMGMSNGIGTIAGLLVPFFVDTITKNKDRESWRNVFIMAACVHFFGVTFYGIFCSGELQPWADPAMEEQGSWNPLDDLGQNKPPVPPPPKVMQSEFIKQPSVDVNAGWNDGGQTEASSYSSQPVINYGSTTNNTNPFHSSNPFASDVHETQVQPPTIDDHSHDVTQQQHQQQWE